MQEQAKKTTRNRIEYVDPRVLRLTDYNPRAMSEKELADLERSVDEFGLVDPIIVRRAGKQIIGGHQRLVVAQSLNLDRVPVIFLDISEQQAKLLNLALNKISGDWNEQKLGELLRELDVLPDRDMSVTGFDDDETKAHLAALEAADLRDQEEDFDVDAAMEAARKKSRIKSGQVWTLGRHRLLCGDATSTEDIDKLLASDPVHLVVTDPPYNVDYQPEGAPSGRTGRRRRKGGQSPPLGPIENDRSSPEDYQQFLNDAFRNLAGTLRESGAWYIFGGTGTFVQYSQAFDAAGLHLSSVIVWDKGSMVLTRKDFHSQYELLFYGWADGKPHSFFGGRSQTDIWTASRDTERERQHPTQKPIELIERTVENSSRPGQTVLDPFVGSGTAIIACERKGRRCLAMEIDPRFCEVTIRRWEPLSSSASRTSSARWSCRYPTRTIR